MFARACGLREHGGFELSPSDFWSMTPGEWWELFDFNLGRRRKEDAETMDRLRRIYYESRGGDPC